MTKIWKIIKYEYTRHVFQKRFLFSLLSLPIIVIAFVGLVFLIAFFSIDKTPVGFIDHSGILSNPVGNDQDGDIFNPVIEFIPYQDEDQAKADLNSDTIQAYYILPIGYPESLDVKLVFQEKPDSEIQNQFGTA